MGKELVNGFKEEVAFKIQNMALNTDDVLIEDSIEYSDFSGQATIQYVLWIQRIQNDFDLYTWIFSTKQVSRKYSNWVGDTITEKITDDPLTKCMTVSNVIWTICEKAFECIENHDFIVDNLTLFGYEVENGIVVKRKD